MTQRVSTINRHIHGSSDDILTPALMFCIKLAATDDQCQSSFMANCEVHCPSLPITLKGGVHV